ncbi:hypothetical protein BZA77DRAFT_343119 [Pyronema omphalodes]|nr:hypothetical protein BZA77DRAFT_343119 [Pyronema omphalodes]
MPINQHNHNHNHIPILPKEVSRSLHGLEVSRDSALDAFMAASATSSESSHATGNTAIMQRQMLLPAPPAQAQAHHATITPPQGMANLPSQFTHWMTSGRMSASGVISESPIPVWSHNHNPPDGNVQHLQHVQHQHVQHQHLQQQQQPQQQQHLQPQQQQQQAPAAQILRNPSDPGQNSIDTPTTEASKTTATRNSTPSISSPQTVIATPDDPVTDSPLPEHQDRISQWTWTRQEKEKILTWLNDSPENYQAWKRNQEKTADKLSGILFNGFRSGLAIRGQWIAMVENYKNTKMEMMETADAVLESEEDIDPEKSVWLEQTCPLYWRIHEIVKRDPTIAILPRSQSQPRSQTTKRPLATVDSCSAGDAATHLEPPTKRGKMNAADRIILDHTMNIKAFQERQLEIQEKI